MKISFITTSSLATNPRLVKEVIVAQEMFREVEVICFNLDIWSDELDEKVKLLFKKNVKINSFSASKRSFSTWLISSITEKISVKISPLFKNFLPVVAIANNKRALLLLYYINKNKLLKGANFLVSHNLGSLYPAYYFSLKLGIPFAFDVEDYHPGEKISKDVTNEVSRREFLMKKLLPKASYISVASPLIGNKVSEVCKTDTIVINNSFFSSEFHLQEQISVEKIKLVWFSQNISFNRGLELLLPALDTLDNHYKLTLIGNLDPDFNERWLKERLYVEILPPIEQIELHRELNKYDIGLALELQSVDYNRDIALTNKLFAYLQAGLYIIATDTSAQKLFFNKFTLHGTVCKQTTEEIKACLQTVKENITDLRNTKDDRFLAAKDVAFENESEKLKELWNNYIGER